MSCGAPQGSVLGPLLFALYIAPLEDIISAHGLDAMMYADDTQPYMRKGNRVVALENLSLCLDDIMSWNLCNMLKCNPSKTEIIHFSSRFSPPEPIALIKVGHHYIQPTRVIKNLGVRLIHTSPLFLMSPTSVAHFHVRFIPLVESENIFRKWILSALSMPSFYRNFLKKLHCLPVNDRIT